MYPARWAVLALLVLAAGSFTPATADVLCKKKNGAVFVRTACKRKETQVDPDALGMRGSKGDKGDPGQQGTTGSTGATGPMGPALVVKDATGAVIGSGFPFFSPEGDVVVWVARTIGSNVVAMLLSGTGFYSSMFAPVWFTSTDCSGPALVEVNPNVGPLLVRVASTIPDNSMIYYPSGDPSSVKVGSTRANLAASCTTSSALKYVAPIATADLTSLGLVPPFHVEGP